MIAGFFIVCLLDSTESVALKLIIDASQFEVDLESNVPVIGETGVAERLGDDTHGMQAQFNVCDIYEYIYATVPIQI